MTARVAALWRYPVKSVGREPLEAVTLATGQTMPWDRHWAVAHADSKATGTEWARCGNFLRVASSPKLAAVESALDEASGTLTLRHPERPELVVNPDEDPQALVDWVAPLVAENRSPAAQLVSVPGRGMTDASFPSISIGNMASHSAVAQRLGTPLSPKRWRCNIFLDGLGPWEEFEWVGNELQIGAARLKVIERCGRCNNVQANPETGKRDLDVLGALASWDHQDFTVWAEVTQGGAVKVGDSAGLL